MRPVFKQCRTILIFSTKKNEKKSMIKNPKYRKEEGKRRKPLKKLLKCVNQISNGTRLGHTVKDLVGWASWGRMHTIKETCMEKVE